MKRLAFNGGEITPAMALRSDMDVFPRSCTELTNFDVHATGGISRRKGFETVANAILDPTSPEKGNTLIPYIYSDDKVFLIEATHCVLCVYNTSDNTLVASFNSLDGWYCLEPRLVTWQQINSILLLLSPKRPIMQLKLNDDMSWSFSKYKFKTPPWHTIDLQTFGIKLSKESNSIYSIAFSADLDPSETEYETGDLLRASFYVPRQQINTTPFPGVSTLKILQDGLSASSKFSAGEQIAIKQTYESCYICVADFDGSRDFTSGCIFPENYMAEGDARFIPADNIADFNLIEPISGLSASSNYKKGARLKLTTGYWKLYTCIRNFDGSVDLNQDYTSPDNYSSYFLPGILMGTPATCQGTWKFHCSGTWYGSYEVRRTYDNAISFLNGAPDLNARWDTLGESFSPIGSPQNNILTGDESDEECYLGLFLTRCRYINDDNVGAGWPADTCQNSLIVPSYKHNMLLESRDNYSYKFTDITPIKVTPPHKLYIKDWSWAAFNSRYGYPTLATIHESRLVLAATKAQPQTIWMSKTDDLNNFQTGKLDTSALHLTMSTTTQADICWLLSRGEVIMLGTEDGEWVISSSSGQGLTPTTARIINHGRVGSAHIPAVTAIDRVLYCERGSGRVYQYGYDWQSNSYTSTDLTIFADHIATQGGGIISGTVQRKPCTRAIFVLADGTLALMAYNTHHQVNAWHRYTTNGKFESICALPNGTAEDKLYAIVSRNGKRYLECLSPNSPYIDAGQHDYTSTISTTALWPPDADERKTPTAPLDAYLPTTTPAANITIRTAEHTPYTPLNHTGNLTPGWVHLIANATWTNRPHFSLQITGPHPFTLLALQL